MTSDTPQEPHYHAQRASNQGGCHANPLTELEQRMSPEQKALVKETWRKVVPMADTAARMFYDRLFEIDATTRLLFKTTNLAEQRRKLIQALTVVVQGLDHLEALVPTLADGPAPCAIRSHGRPLR